MVPPYVSCGFAFHNCFCDLMSRFEGYCNDNNNATSHHPHHSFALEDDSSLNETASTSKDLVLHDQEPPAADKGWLRLSIGDTHHHHSPPDLHLLPPAVHSKVTLPDFSQPPPPELNWTFTPISPHNSSSFIPFGPYFSTPFQLHSTGLDLTTAAAPAAGPSSHTFTVIDPPRRPHSGIWFSLQPLDQFNQGKPQRSSSYLRIKDGRMTVRLLIKYLVKKLRLDNESQIEIRCRGEKLEGWLTMQHIRDKIWCSNNSKHLNYYSSTLTLLPPHSSTIDHIMVLHYATHPN